MPATTCPLCGGSGKTIDGAILLSRRQKAKLTLKDVSSKMGISLQYLADLEHGRRRCTPQLLDDFNKAILSLEQKQ